MSIDNRNGNDPKKIYSLGDRPKGHKSGGKPDKEGVDSYWGPSKTLQADEQNANIHFLMARYEKTGQLPQLIRENPQYGDFSDMPTYQESLNLVIHANNQFAALDAKIRSRFQNDPAQFLAFANNPENLEEMVKMGLAVKKAEMPPVNVGQGQPATPPATLQA